MSENAHIDKIFKDGLGERNFPNADAMWQNMEAELDKENKKKRRPFVFFIAMGGLITSGIFIAHFFNTVPVSNKIQSVIVAENKNILPASTQNNATIINNNTSGKNVEKKVVGHAIASETNDHNTTLLIASKHKQVYSGESKFLATLANAKEMNLDALPNGTQSINENELTGLQEKINSDADLITAFPLEGNKISIKRFYKKATPSSPLVKKGLTPIKSKISIEALIGRDFLRMNRKAAVYAGIRLNKQLDEGSVVSVGLNYASHNLLDRYKLNSKQAGEPQPQAKINNISTLRVPVYLQRQMGKSKFALMAGLVPSYVLSADIYNLPDSYGGNNIDDHRRFTISDINRFNLLFGAGIKYSPYKWVALEVSGSYGLTGIVKNAYKNQSRVNDNFKSIQVGLAFKLK